VITSNALAFVDLLASVVLLRARHFSGSPRGRAILVSPRAFDGQVTQ